MTPPAVARTTVTINVAITISPFFILLASVCSRVTIFRLATLAIEFYRLESFRS